MSLRTLTIRWREIKRALRPSDQVTCPPECSEDHSYAWPCELTGDGDPYFQSLPPVFDVASEEPIEEPNAFMALCPSCGQNVRVVNNIVREHTQPGETVLHPTNPNFDGWSAGPRCGFSSRPYISRYARVYMPGTPDLFSGHFLCGYVLDILDDPIDPYVEFAVAHASTRKYEDLAVYSEDCETMCRCIVRSSELRRDPKDADLPSRLYVGAAVWLAGFDGVNYSGRIKANLKNNLWDVEMLRTYGTDWSGVQLLQTPATIYCIDGDRLLLEFPG